MAMVQDPRIRAQAVGDADLLNQEQRKRNAWHWENALRRHNFVGFIGEMVKGVTRAKLDEGNGVYEKWIEDAKANTKTKLEDRKKHGKSEEE